MKNIILFFLPFVCFAQTNSYDLLKKLPKLEFEKAVTDSITKLDSSDLWNFLYHLKDGDTNSLKPFNNSFVEKLKSAKYPMDMHFLLEILLEQNTEKTIVERILNQKQEIWDKGEWSEKMWNLIRAYNLQVYSSAYYSVNQNGEKNYNLNIFLQGKIRTEELGTNPILYLNYKIVSYPENQLLDTLNKLNIKDIQVTPKSKSVGLYGKRGIDGMIMVLTR